MVNRAAWLMLVLLVAGFVTLLHGRLGDFDRGRSYEDRRARLEPSRSTGNTRVSRPLPPERCELLRSTYRFMSRQLASGADYNPEDLKQLRAAQASALMSIQRQCK